MIKRSIRLLLIVIMITVSLSAVCACNKKHEHTYKEGWEHDETYHWRIATCGDIEIGLKGKHNFVDGVCTLCKYENPNYVPPEKPDTDDPSDNPNDPDIPDNPDITGDSDDPDLSDDPSGPDDPIDPDNPDDPIDPNLPDAPSEPDYSDDPYSKYIRGQEETSNGLLYTELFDDSQKLVGYSVGKPEGGFSSAELNIPDNYKDKPILEIDEFGFQNCKQIGSVKFPAQLETIGYGAFMGCAGIRTIDVPNSVATIDSQAFKSCTSLESIKLPNIDAIRYQVFYLCQSLKEIEIPEGVKSIEKMAFYGCKKLSKLKLPSTLKSIGTEAFNDCLAIYDIDISDLSAFCGITTSGDRSSPMRTCQNLTSNGKAVTEIEIKDGVEKISSYIFCDCKAIKSIIIPSSVKSIDTYAFMNSGLEKITFQEGLTDIGDYAFEKCTLLKEVSLPNSLLNVGRMAFYNCFSMQKMVMGKNVQRIGGGMLGVDLGHYSDVAKCTLYYRGSESDWNRVSKDGDWRVRRTVDLSYNYVE